MPWGPPLAGKAAPVSSGSQHEAGVRASVSYLAGGIVHRSSPRGTSTLVGCDRADAVARRTKDARKG